MTCKRCAGPLRTDGARMIGVCHGCIAASHAPVAWPKPPGYSWNRRPEPVEDGPGRLEDLEGW